MGSTPNCVSHILASPPSPPASRPISQATLAAIRSIPLVDIAGSVVKLRRAGRQFVGLCPFHSERTPSFSVDPEKNVWFCHGCSAGGDVISFIQRLERCDFRQAVTVLAERFGISIEPGIVDRSKLAWRAELHSIDEQLRKILLREEIRLSLKLAPLRNIINSRTIENLPCNVFDQLRRADARFVLAVLATEDDRLQFLCSSSVGQERRIDEALDDGYVRSGKCFWETPL